MVYELVWASVADDSSKREEARAELDMMRPFFGHKAAHWAKTAYHNLGSRHYREGELDRAARAYQQALEFGPGDPEAAHSLAMVLGLLGQGQAGISVLEQMISRGHDGARIRLLLGSLHHGNGRPLAATQNWLRGLELAPNDMDLNYNIAITYQVGLGWPQKAIPYWLRAIELGRQGPKAFALLANAYTEAGDLTRAGHWHQRLVESYPESPEALDLPIRCAGLPACLAPRTRLVPPTRVLHRTLFDVQDGRINAEALLRHHVQHGYRVKSARCADCLVSSRCPGAHINLVRHLGLAELNPLLPAAGSWAAEALRQLTLRWPDLPLTVGGGRPPEPPFVTGSTRGLSPNSPRRPTSLP